MSVKELQTLTQKFADAFDQRDLQPILDMLSDDVRLIQDHTPKRRRANRRWPWCQKGGDP